MKFKIFRIYDVRDSSGILDITINNELRSLVRKYYKRKRCTNKLISRFLNEGIDLYFERYGICKK